MKKIQPVEYYPDRRVVRTEPDGEYREFYFIEQAALRYRRYGEPELLLWAIDNALPGLIESPHAREIFKDLITTGKVRRRGQSTKKALNVDEQRSKVWQRVWYHHGRGLPIYTSDNSNSSATTACDETASELGLSAKQVYNIWTSMGGHNRQGAALLVAHFWKSEGIASRDAVPSK